MTCPPPLATIQVVSKCLAYPVPVGLADQPVGGGGGGPNPVSLPGNRIWGLASGSVGRHRHLAEEEAKDCLEFWRSARWVMACEAQVGGRGGVT